MKTKFFTNTDGNTLLQKFEGVFKYNPNISCFDILVGYFRASGYFRVRPFLEKIPKIRILVGIDVDKLIQQAQEKGMDYLKNIQKTKEEFIDAVKQDIAQANYDYETEKGMLQLIEDITTQKVQIKAHPDKKIHAKVYIFRPEPFNEHTPASVITGSSNLTDSGLQHNYEFNVQLSDYDDVKFATDEFEKLWKEGITILPVDAQKIKKETHLNDEITPFELYIKLLIEYFDKNIEYDPDSIKDLPKNFKKLSYQIDAVNQGYDMLLKHNGFMLSDVVGLGKTVVATMVARKFITENGLNTKILVVYPPAVEKNWKNTFKYFNIDRYAKFITNGSLNKILEGDINYWEKEDYDLIIVDESHKFRNHNTGAFANLQQICKSPRQNKGYVPGLKKKVILVSATPLNNRPEDIFNQIRLFQDDRQSTLPVTNLTAFFTPLIDEYKKIKRDEKGINITKLRAIYEEIRKNIIEPITIRRTRKDLENNPEYLKDIEAQGIKFPKVNPPKKVEYGMDAELNELFCKTVEYLIEENGLKYARYQAIAYLKREAAEGKYGRAEMVSKNLAFIMKTQLIKRLESSFEAFKNSLIRFQKATQNMIDMFHNNKVFIAPDADINILLEKYSEDEIEKIIEQLNEENPKNHMYKATDFQDEFIHLLEDDKKLIDELVQKWCAYQNDPKLEVFLQYLNTTLLDKNINIERKLVIFTESAETARYLQQVLQKSGRQDVLAIDSSNRKEKHEVIMANFDANLDPKEQKNDFNIIITTEVLAEGVNLHRANVILHYDTPWNSTRMIQRIGRVNRIGSKADAIYNYVFYPSVQGDEQLKLQKTAFMKIQAFHTAYGEDNQVFSDKEILDDVKLFTPQAIEDQEEDKRLKYLFFLRRFREENKAEFQKIKNMPYKCRTARQSNTIQKTHLSKHTVVFLKNPKKFEFYLVNDDKIKEITPLEAIEIFEAQTNEKPHTVTQNYFEHVQKAIQEFETQEKTQVISHSQPEAFGSLAMGAKKYLKDLSALSSKLTAYQKDYIPKLIANIDAGIHTNLPKEVSKLEKRKLNLDEALAELDKIAKKYLSEYTENTDNKKIIQKPTLILSEFFV